MSFNKASVSGLIIIYKKVNLFQKNIYLLILFGLHNTYVVSKLF